MKCCDYDPRILEKVKINYLEFLLSKMFSVSLLSVARPELILRLYEDTLLHLYRYVLS
jgi:hypothetical protein